MKRKRRRYRRKAARFQDIPAKANTVLNIVLVGLLLVALRAWHLSVVQYDYHAEQSKKPQKRVVIEPAVRGTIRDRFNIPLAINKVQYNAAIIYSQIRQVPSVVWKKGPNGKRIRHLKRREYIENLVAMLGRELDLDPERLEDLVHSKASFHGHLPFIIKENITEKQYYRLKMMEKDWFGVQVQCCPQRYYPQGKVGCDIIGYMGSISRNQYDGIIHELKELQEYVHAREEGVELLLPEHVSSPYEVRRRLKDLQEKAYTINDYVGKSGVEARFEETLRGFHGKKSYYSDARGNFLREFPGSRDPMSGQRVLLTISSEVQEFAENLLMQNENIRKGRVSGISSQKQTKLGKKEPWIKGGAVVAMDPNSGDVVCMASYPRFDPNDFISSGHANIVAAKQSNVRQWFETESYIAEVWHGKRALEKEVFNLEKKAPIIQKLELTWENYLNIVLAEESPVKTVLQKIGTVEKAVELQRDVDNLMRLGGFHNAYAVFNHVYTGAGHTSHGKNMRANDREAMEENFDIYADQVAQVKARIDPFLAGLKSNYDKVLVVDLCRLAVSNETFTPDLIQVVGGQKLSDYRDVNRAFVTVENLVEEMAKRLYHELTFIPWRKKNQRAFLKEKRAEEKANNQYAKPYLDYLDREEKLQFAHFWEKHRWRLMLTFISGDTGGSITVEEKPYYDHFFCWNRELSNGAHSAVSWLNAYQTLSYAVKPLGGVLSHKYLQTLRRYDQLDRVLLGSYRHLRKEEGVSYEKHLAAAFYPRYGYGFARSQAYRQAAVQGSIFKIVTAYEALVQQYNRLNGRPLNLSQLNPMVIEDRVFRQGRELYYGYGPDGEPIPRYHKGGRLIRSLSSNIGEVDLLKAMEVSSNPYFSLLASECLDDPLDLTKAACDFSFGSKTGIDLTAEIKGNVPYDLDYNRTGLYATAIGQHSLVVTPLQTAVMLSSLANHGKVLKPKIVRMIAGEKPKRQFERVSHQRDFAYKDSLASVGIDFSLFSAATNSATANTIQIVPTETKRNIFLPGSVREILFEGMDRVTRRINKRGIWSLTSLYKDYPGAISDLVEMEGQMIGKTSTGESMENLDLDIECGTNLYNHVWYGGVVFDNKKPETFVYRDKFGNPELVVVAYLRYGSFGKDAAPVAAQVARKWREVKKKYQQSDLSL